VLARRHYSHDPGSGQCLRWGRGSRLDRGNHWHWLAVGRPQLLAAWLCQTLQQQGIKLLAPFRHASSKRVIKHSRVLGRFSYRIDTVIGHLTDRFRLKHVWAGDLWHLRNRRLLLVLMHAPGVYFNQQEHAPVLLLARPLV
jgi:hypothetical protein